jgi:hypothetical protein
VGTSEEASVPAIHLSVYLGGEEGDGVTLHLRQSADRLLSCNVAVRAGGFSANLETEMFIDELLDLQRQLLRVREEVSGILNFSNELRGREFTLVMDKTGRAAVEGTARDLARGTRLFFTFFTDQSYLAETASELADVLTRIG